MIPPPELDPPEDVPPDDVPPDDVPPVDVPPEDVPPVLDVEPPELTGAGGVTSGAIDAEASDFTLGDVLATTTTE
jgi:hypothetical protein